MQVPPSIEIRFFAVLRQSIDRTVLQSKKSSGVQVCSLARGQSSYYNDSFAFYLIIFLSFLAPVVICIDCSSINTFMDLLIYLINLFPVKHK